MANQYWKSGSEVDTSGESHWSDEDAMSSAQGIADKTIRRMLGFR
jgi:hypothetical protein